MLSQQILNGVVLGAIYCLFSVGFNLMFGVAQIINLVYGVYFAGGAITGLLISRDFGLPLYLTLPLSGLAVGAAAALIDRLLIAPLKGRAEKHMASLMITMGASLFFYSLVQKTFGTEARGFPKTLGIGERFNIGIATITDIQIIILLLTPILMALLFVALRYSKLGISIRAAAENERAAELMGIEPRFVITVVSFIAGFMAGIAGLLIGMNFDAVHSFMGEFMMLRGFVIIIVGGLGSLPGAAIAGFCLGIVEVLTTGYISSQYKEVVTFSILLGALWLFPTGIFKEISAQRP